MNSRQGSGDIAARRADFWTTEPFNCASFECLIVYWQGRNVAASEWETDEVVSGALEGSCELANNSLSKSCAADDGLRRRWAYDRD
jgi:hypothetical protein